jgi:hypothetical protein
MCHHDRKKMNTFLASLIISSVISILCVITKPKNAMYPSEESSFAHGARAFIISFVCCYFGMMYLIAPVCPEILQNEPDF